MNKYKIIYKDGKELIVEANTSLEVVREYDLSTRENISTRIIQLDK